MSQAHRLLPGSTFAGRYRVGRALGQGVMGAVYVAEELDGGARRALKVMSPTLAADARFVERFELEARVGERIASEHVVRVHGSGVDAATGLPWLAMEWLEGRDLGARLAEGPMPAPVAREVLDQLFEAIAAAHAVGVVHRDLKPENVLVGEPAREGGPVRVRVLDFGVAKIVHDATLSGTAPGLGTPLWTAPEQGVEGATIRPSADVWALGLLTFRLLAGRTFWRHAQDKASAYELAVELLRAPIPRASDRARELDAPGALPAGFDAWFARAVARDPAARFEDAGAARAALEAIVPLRARGPGRGRAARVAAIVLAAVLVLAAVAAIAAR